MTNPYPAGGSYSNTPTPNLNNFRRSSYASVAAGTASAISPPHSPPSARTTTPGTLLQLFHMTEDVDGQREREREASSYANSSFVTAPTTNMSSIKTSLESPWPLMLHPDNSLGDDLPPSPPDFVCPSYLRKSRYVQRLAEEHKATVAAATESLRQGKHHVFYNKDNSSSTAISASSSGLNLHKLSSAFAKAPVQDFVDRTLPTKSTDELNKLPSCWSDLEKCSGLEILNEGTEVRFQGQTKTSDEAAAIRSDHPMPKEVGLYYFEVTILSRHKEGLIGIGFSGPKANLNRLPGWEPESWAYHGDDGFSFACTASGKQYGPKYSAFDVIGCGLNFDTASAFFTKNGQYLGEAFHNIKTEKLYPSVGMKKPGEHLRINFGATPFVFDIDSMMENLRARVREEVNRTSVTSLESSLEERSLVQELIAQYLAHDGYVETARAFADEVHGQRRSLSQNSQPLKMFDPSQDIHATNRQKIRSAILDGDIDNSLKYINTCYPHVLERGENRDVYFRLRCRKFIEMMRRSTEIQQRALTQQSKSSKATGKLPEKHMQGELDHQMELDEQLQRESGPPTIPPLSVPGPLDPNMAFLASGNGSADDAMDMYPDQPSTAPSATKAWMTQQSLLSGAIEYGRELKAEFGGDQRPAVKQTLCDIFALIAYTDIEQSVMSGLMNSRGRVEIAEEVNAAILVSLGKPPSAALEKVCAQTEVLLDMLSVEGGSAAFLNVSKDCLQ